MPEIRPENIPFVGRPLPQQCREGKVASTSQSLGGIISRINNTPIIKHQNSHSRYSFTAKNNTKYCTPRVNAEHRTKEANNILSPAAGTSLLSSSSKRGSTAAMNHGEGQLLDASNNREWVQRKPKRERSPSLPKLATKTEKSDIHSTFSPVACYKLWMFIF